jgi:hypothetical protein
MQGRKESSQMRKNEEIPDEKASKILRQMREDAGSKKHLDQQKLRAQAALGRAVEARDEQAFVAALTALGIDPGGETGRPHLRGFRQLPSKRY